MKIYKEIDLQSFDAWQGAIETKQIILENYKQNAFNSLIEELYPNGIDETQLNDILWFESDYLYEVLNINY